MLQILFTSELWDWWCKKNAETTRDPTVPTSSSTTSYELMQIKEVLFRTGNLLNQSCLQPIHFDTFSRFFFKSSVIITFILE